MKLGMISGFDGKSFDFIKENGLEFMEICLNYDQTCNRFIDAKESIKENVARTGIPVQSVGRWNHEINKGGRLDKEKLDLYFNTLDAAKEIGSKVFVCGINYDDSVSKYKNYTAAIELFGLLLQRAGDMKIAVANCDWNNFVVTPADWEIVIGELPALTIKYDCSHAYNRGSDYLREINDWGEHISHFHIKGTTHAGKRPVDDPPAGMDDIKWGSFFSILYARKYDGGLSIEPHSETWQGELGHAGIKFTQNYIKQFIIK